MDSSFVRSLRAVWLARWQELSPRLAYWLLLAGYDLRDRSLADLLYLPYLVAFWLVWVFAMSTALSGVVATLLQMLNQAAPALPAVSITLWVMLLWALVTLYRAMRRSPLVFSPADAYLLCQTPTDRRAVAGIWFLTDWPARVLPFAAWSLLAGFAVFEAQNLIETLDPLLVIRYWIEGLRALSIVLPLHLLLLALIWAAGAWRLHGRGGNLVTRWLPAIAILVLMVLVLAALESGPFDLPALALWRTLATPLLAAFGESPWLPTMLFTLVAALVALVLLLFGTRRLSLSRAAHETSHIYSERFLAQAGAHHAAHDLKRQRLLGAAARRSMVPVRPGCQVSVWKDLARSVRRWQEHLRPWLGMLALSAGMAAAPDWVSRLVALVFWTQVTANRGTSRLGDNLAHWWMWRQQPSTNRQLVTASVAPPTVLLVLLSLATSVIGHRLPWSRDFVVDPLLPLLTVLIVLVATWDLLGRIRPESLLAGEIPRVSALGWFLSLILAATSLGTAWLVAQLTAIWWMGIAAAVILSLLIIGLIALSVRNRAGELGIIPRS